jgi:hypothetical protein
MNLQPLAVPWEQSRGHSSYGSEPDLRKVDALSAFHLPNYLFSAAALLPARFLVAEARRFAAARLI